MITSDRWYARPATEALSALAASPSGLGEDEARARLVRDGPNAIAPAPPTPAWRILVAQLRGVVTWLLIGAAATAGITGDAADSVAILVVLVLNVALGFATEIRARRAVEALARLEVPYATVVRDGQPARVDARTLVRGDVIELEAGQIVPADARLLRVAELTVAEAPLTGESVPVAKVAEPPVPDDTPLPDRCPMVYAGTTVATGAARALVVATGMGTELGHIGALVGSIAEEPTPLERRLDALGRTLVAISLGVGVLVALRALTLHAPLATVIEIGLAVAVAAVPEGLPALVTIAVAIGTRRMARRHALIRHPPAVESLGATTVICTDKTGTLTSGNQTVTAVWIPDREIAVTGVGLDLSGRFRIDGAVIAPREDRLLASALRTAATANRATLGDGDGGRPHGDPTEVALLVAARKAGIDRSELARACPEVGELPFSSARMLMATFHRARDGRLVAEAKGATSRILERCDAIATDRGPEALDAGARHRVLERERALAARGLRVLALASGPVAAPDDHALRALTFEGLVGLIDPPAADVPETIATLRRAGIRVIMLTGDQRDTARAIARELGLLAPGDEVLDGGEIDRLDDEALERRMVRAAALSRVSPEAKLRIVAALQRRGEIVAMLGDGVNDAAALRKADVGVAMGLRGTDAAREAAGIVLEDDRFATVAAAVEEGRVVFANIRKFVFYLFSCNLAEVATLLGAGLAGLPLPLTPLQILWLNLVTDTAPALALAVEPSEPRVMRRPPRDPRSALLSRRLLRDIAAYALLIAGATVGAFVVALRWWPDDRPRAVTIAFTTLAIGQLLHLGNARSREPVLHPRALVRNRYALVAVLGSVALQVMAVSLPPLARVLGATTLGPRAWLIAAGFSLLPALIGQSAKALLASARRRGSSAVHR